MEVLGGIFIILALVWFWSDSSQAKEFAVKAAARSCDELDVQFLDQTVTLHRIKLARNALGQRTLQRAYRFEFCTNGSERYQGLITLQALRVNHIELNHPDGKIINPANMNR